MLVCSVYIMWLQQFKLWKVSSMVGSIVVVSVLARCEFLHSVCDVKATQMNMQHNLIQELVLYEFELSHNTIKFTKNICCTKWERVIDHCTKDFAWVARTVMIRQNIRQA